MRRRETFKINDVLRLYWKDNPEMYHQMMEARILRLWGEVLGTYVSNCTSNIYIKNRILFVTMTSSIVRSELVSMRKRLVVKLNDQAGSDVIEDIVIK
jgi:hypothetical protein